MMTPSRPFRKVLGAAVVLLTTLGVHATTAHAAMPSQASMFADEGLSAEQPNTWREAKRTRIRDNRPRKPDRLRAHPGERTKKRQPPRIRDYRPRQPDRVRARRGRRS
jgi:hypothetical protein